MAEVPTEHMQSMRLVLHEMLQSPPIFGNNDHTDDEEQAGYPGYSEASEDDDYDDYDDYEDSFRDEPRLGVSHVHIHGRPVEHNWEFGEAPARINRQNPRFWRPDIAPAAPLHVATKAQEGEEACFICMDNKPDSTFDCGHSGVCCVCADTLLKTTKKCPLCRETFTSFSVNEESSDKDGDSDASDDL